MPQNATQSESLTTLELPELELAGVELEDDDSGVASVLPLPLPILTQGSPHSLREASSVPWGAGQSARQ